MTTQRFQVGDKITATFFGTKDGKKVARTQTGTVTFADDRRCEANDFGFSWLALDRGIVNVKRA